MRVNQSERAEQGNEERELAVSEREEKICASHRGGWIRWREREKEAKK